MKNACGRCGGPALISVMSFFDTNIICMRCSIIEENHPEYGKAKIIEEQHLRMGNRNYPGVGAPSDLKTACMEAKRFGNDYEKVQQFVKDYY